MKDDVTLFHGCHTQNLALLRIHEQSGLLLSDVQQAGRVARVFGVRNTEQSLPSVAQRALELDGEEIRAVAAALLAELDKMPKFRRG